MKNFEKMSIFFLTRYTYEMKEYKSEVEDAMVLAVPATELAHPAEVDETNNGYFSFEQQRRPQRL